MLHEHREQAGADPLSGVMEMQVEISTEHSDYFTRNLVAVRAEKRLPSGPNALPASSPGRSQLHRRARTPLGEWASPLEPVGDALTVSL